MVLHRRGLQLRLSLDEGLAPASAVASPRLVPDEEPVDRAALKQITGKVDVIMFDFDGTLTETPGIHARRQQKAEELRQRRWLLQPCLEALCGAGLKLGVLSKSSTETLEAALDAADLRRFFEGPVKGKAVGFEGKAGFIQGFCAQGGALAQLETRAGRVLLVDDDPAELERCLEAGIQTYAAPARGGLQAADFHDLFGSLGLPCTAAQCVASGTAISCCCRDGAAVAAIEIAGNESGLAPDTERKLQESMPRAFGDCEQSDGLDLTFLSRAPDQCKGMGLGREAENSRGPDATQATVASCARACRRMPLGLRLPEC